MPNVAKKPKSGAERAAAYRERMRAKGLVPKTIWVPDTKDPKFIAEYRRQCQAIAADVEGEREIMAWVGAAYEGMLDGEGIPDYEPPKK